MAALPITLKRDLFSSIKGEGTVIISGPSDCGKNVFLRHQMKKYIETFRGSGNSPYRYLIVLSTTGKLNKDWIDFGDMADKKIQFAKNIKQVKDAMERIKECAEEVQEKEGPEAADEWKGRNRVAIVLNDFTGICNVSSPHTPILAYSTMFRHLRGIMIICAQHSPTVNPGVFNNAKWVVSFDKTKKAISQLAEKIPLDTDETTVKTWNTEDHCFTLWPMGVKEVKTTTPLLCFPLEEGRNISAYVSPEPSW